MDALQHGFLFQVVALLHLIYESFDLVLQVLYAYDAKMKTSLGSAYFTALTTRSGNPPVPPR